MAPQMDSHYWEHVLVAEQWMAELEALHGDDTPTGRTRRQVLSAEVQALEAHLQRELAEAAYLALGHRIV